MWQSKKQWKIILRLQEYFQKKKNPNMTASPDKDILLCMHYPFLQLLHKFDGII